MRKFRRDQRSVKPRVLLLLAALVVTAIWAQSEMKPRGGSPAAGTRKSPGSAIAATTTPTAAGDQATPEGWGADPFDPRSSGSTRATTGR